MKSKQEAERRTNEVKTRLLYVGCHGLDTPPLIGWDMTALAA